MFCQNDDLEFVAPLVIEYQRWLTTGAGRDPEAILRLEMTQAQRKLLLERMDDVATVLAILAPIRAAHAAATTARVPAARSATGRQGEN